MKKQSGEIIFNAIYRASIIMLFWVTAGAVSTNDTQVAVALISIFIGLLSVAMIATYEAGMVEEMKDEDE